jgi:hypothetical protein
MMDFIIITTVLLGISVFIWSIYSTRKKYYNEFIEYEVVKE